MPRAINSVIGRIAIFYVGSLTLLALLLPYTAFKAGESPFVTFFSRLGVGGAGSLMNVVVLTAAFSSLNAGLYSTGRVLRSMSVNGSAPTVAARMSARGVPFVGILATGTVALLGVGLNAVVPQQAFEIVLNMSALGTVSTWGTIVLCHLQLWRWSRRNQAERPTFRLVGAPYTGLATLAFLIGVVALMASSDSSIQRWAVVSVLAVMGPLLTIGWFASRRRAGRIAAERETHQRMRVSAEGPLPTMIESKPGESEGRDSE